MKIIIKSCINCPFMYNDDHDGEPKCNLQNKVNEESNNIITESEIDANPEWCPLLIEDYNFSLNVDNDIIYDEQMEEFNKSIENINSQIDSLKNASDELSKIINNIDNNN